MFKGFINRLCLRLEKILAKVASGAETKFGLAQFKQMLRVSQISQPPQCSQLA